MVAAGHPLAAATGLRILAGGGNAFDAVVAMAAAIAVVEPAMNSIGGDSFAIVSPRDHEPFALNASGPAPLAARPEDFGARINPNGLAAATLPGAVKAWERLHRQHCRLSWHALLQPAIDYAREGVPASSFLAAHAREHRAELARFEASAEVFLPGGEPIGTGQILRQADLAHTLEEIAAAGDSTGLYSGSFAAALDRHARSSGRPHRASDLDRVACERHIPLQVDYLGHRVLAQPPVSQGYVTLAALKIAEYAGAGELDFADPGRIHLAIEAKKRAFALRHQFLGDPRHRGLAPTEFLRPNRLRAAAAAIDRGRAWQQGPPGTRSGTDTTCLAAADREGNCIAYIQSIFAAFGCREMIPGTGVLMNNRMTGFSLDRASPNHLRGGAHPVHTLMTWMVTDEGAPIAFGSTAGGHYQVQTNAQLIENHLRFGMSLQSSLEAPRFGHDEISGQVFVEERFGRPLAPQLTQLGHAATSAGLFGAGSRALAIGRNPATGTFSGASDPRWHGIAIGL